MSEIILNTKELASTLVALAIFCMNEGTDNCEIPLITSKGKIKCHVEFYDVDND